MQDVLKLDKKEQLELIGDPFVQDIIDIINFDIVTRETIINGLDGNAKLIDDYLDRLIKYDILTEVESENFAEKKIRLTAKSIEGKEIIFKHLKENDLGWLNGYINHLENRIVDFYKFLGNLDGPKEKLEKFNYTSDLLTTSSKVYLTSQEAEEFVEKISHYLSKDWEERQQQYDHDSEYNLYEFYGYLFPDLKKFKEKVKNTN